MRVDRLEVQTKDGYYFQGEIYLPAEDTQPETCVIFFDGASMDFHSSAVAWPLAEALTGAGVAFAYATNRGTGVERYTQREVGGSAGVRRTRALVGHASERFSECQHDVAAWEGAISSLGYRVILAGHSLGASKVAFSVKDLAHQPDGLLLIAPVDMVRVYKKKDLDGSIVAEALSMAGGSQPSKPLQFGRHRISPTGLLELQLDGAPGDVFPFRCSSLGETLLDVSCHVGVLYGREDPLTVQGPQTDGERLLASARSAKSRDLMLAPGDHVFRGAPVDFASAATRWVSRVREREYMVSIMPPSERKRACQLGL